MKESYTGGYTDFNANLVMLSEASFQGGCPQLQDIVQPLFKNEMRYCKCTTLPII